MDGEGLAWSGPAGRGRTDGARALANAAPPTSPPSARPLPRVAVDQGLLVCQGKTPEATMASALYTDVKRKGHKSLFTRHGGLGVGGGGGAGRWRGGRVCTGL